MHRLHEALPVCRRLSGTRGKGLCVSRLGPQTAAGGPAPSGPRPLKGMNSEQPGALGSVPSSHPPRLGQGSCRPWRHGCCVGGGLALRGMRAGGWGVRGGGQGRNRSHGRRAQVAGGRCAGGLCMTGPQAGHGWGPPDRGPARGHTAGWWGRRAGRRAQDTRCCCSVVRQ